MLFSGPEPDEDPDEPDPASLEVKSNDGTVLSLRLENDGSTSRSWYRPYTGRSYYTPFPRKGLPQVITRREIRYRFTNSGPWIISSYRLGQRRNRV
jgi:hypothetical protein